MSWRRKTYDELPALSVRGAELRRSLRLVTIAWMYGVVWLSCAQGSQVKVFATMLGFDNIAFGLMTAVPFIATLGNLAASVLIERSGLKKYQFLYTATLSRFMWIVIAVIPLVLPLPSKAAVWTMLAILMISWSLNALASPAWLTWMGDLVPKRVRGRYFANRQIYSRPAQIIAAIALGVVLDAATDVGKPETAAAQPMLLWVICGIFAVAGVFGMMDILLFRKVREVLPRVSTPPSPATLRDVLISPLKDPVFRHFVGYGATIAFATALPGWFFYRNAMENLGFSKLAVNALFLVISPVLGLLGAQLWGKLVDRWGRRPVLVLGTLMTLLSVMPWFFATRHTPAPAFVYDAVNAVFRAAGSAVGRPDWLTLTHEAPVGAFMIAVIASVLGGIAWTGISLAQTAITLGFSDGLGRSKHVAASAVLISVGGMAGGVLGGLLAQYLVYFETHPLHVGPFIWNNWHATFAASLVFRIVALAWLVRMPDPGSRGMREILRGSSQKS